MEEFYGWLQTHAREILDWASLKFPVFATVALFMGTLRVWFKPLMTAVEKAVADTPSKRDDEWLLRTQRSRAFRIFLWLLDFFASVKAPPLK